MSHLLRGYEPVSQEQTTGIGQVAQAVGQMDETTQQNAALVEQAAAAAESLSEQAAGLVRAVAVFRLENSQPVQYKDSNATRRSAASRAKLLPSPSSATLGYTIEELQGRNPRVLNSGEQDRGFYVHMWENLNAQDNWRHWPNR